MSENTRRTFLKTVGLSVGAVGLANARTTNGSTAVEAEPRSSDHASRNRSPPDGDSESDWPSYKYDAKNTGYTRADVSGPVRFDWCERLGENKLSPPVLSDGVAYFVDIYPDEVIAYDLDDRTEKWRVSPLDANCDSDPGLTNGNYLTVADETVYCPIGNTLYALDSEDGRTRWRFDGVSPEISAPTIADETVYFGDGHRGHNAYAVDADDGTLKWSHEAGYEFGSADECIPSVADGVVYAPYDEYMVALDAETGDRLWRYEYGYQAGSAPVVADDRVVWTTNEGGSDYVYAVSVDDGTLDWRIGQGYYKQPFAAHGVIYLDGAAYDGNSGSRRWSNVPEPYDFGETIAVTDDTVFSVFTRKDATYEGSYEDYLVASDADDGTIRWEYGPDSEVPFGDVNRFAVVDDAIYSTTLEGELLSFAVEG